MPHYYEADPILQDFAELIPAAGSNGHHMADPNECVCDLCVLVGEYGTYMDIEPASGLTFRGHQRLQVNTLVNKTADGTSCSIYALEQN